MMKLPCEATSDALDEWMSAPPAEALAVLQRTVGDIAVLGASGKMGFQLCGMLRRGFDALGKPNRVVAVSRFTEAGARRKFEAAGLDVVAADLSDPQSLAQLPDWQTVFYLAGVKFGASEASGLLQKTNIDMPGMVARRFRDAALVVLSTGCVYSFVAPDSGGSTEGCATEPVGAYARSCLGREAAFVRAAEEFGTRSALVRLNYAIDLRYGVLLDIAQWVRSGVAVDVTMGHVNVIWQTDALVHTIQALEHVAAPPFVINVAGSEVLRVRDLAVKFAARFGVGDSLAISGREAAEVWLNDATKAHRLFGDPKVSVDAMIDWTVGWLENGGATLGKPTRFEVNDGSY